MTRRREKLSLPSEASRTRFQAPPNSMSSVDFSSLRDEVVKLTQTVSDLMQRQASSAGTQMMDAVGSAADSISRSTSAAQDKLISLESEVGSSIQKNPWRAVVIAAVAGLLIGKLT